MQFDVLLFDLGALGLFRSGKGMDGCTVGGFVMQALSSCAFTTGGFEMQALSCFASSEGGFEMQALSSFALTAGIFEI